MIQVNGLEQNTIMRFIQSSYNVLASNMEAFHHLKFRGRYASVAEKGITLILKAYGETEDGKAETYENSELHVTDKEVTDFIDAVAYEIKHCLDASVFLQIAPRTTVVLQNTPFNANVEIQFLNMNIDELYSTIRHDSAYESYTGYPGVEFNILIRPLDYQVTPVQQPDYSAVVPPRTVTPEPAADPVDREENSEEIQKLQSFMDASFAQMVENAKAHASDSEEPSNPYEEVTAPIQSSGSVSEDFWKILRERGAERSKFNEKDNDMQKRISTNKLSDDSKNVLDIIEEGDDEAMVANAREASDDNLDEMFADDDEPMPEPPAK